MQFEGSKDDLRKNLNQYREHLRLMMLAATALLNQQVQWEGDVGTSEFYGIRITRWMNSLSSLPSIKTVEEIK